MDKDYDEMYPEGRMIPRRMVQPQNYYPQNRTYPRVPSQGNIRPMPMYVRRNGYPIPTRSHYPPQYDPRYVPQMGHQVSGGQRRRLIGFNQMENYDQGQHIDEGLAMYVMSKLYYTDRHGTPHQDPKWTIEEIEQITSEWEFEPGVTIFDKWIAFNFFYADTCKLLSPKEALKVGYYFYFQDEDAPSDKIFRYLEGMGLIDD